MHLTRLLRSATRELLPPVLHRALGHLVNRSPAVPNDPEIDRFYRSMVRAGSLCFDIGANVGIRTASLRRVGCRVVALEPQSSCFAELERKFGNDSGVVLVKKAAGAAVSTGTIHLSEAAVLSTMSTHFMEATSTSGRFAGVKWDKSEQVEITTLDELIAEHGTPDFIKIDVEGFELEVVKGLSRMIPLIALEWTPEMNSNLLGCVDHLQKLGPIELNVSWGESHRLSQSRWMDRSRFESMAEVFRDETYLFADVYVRPAQTGSGSRIH